MKRLLILSALLIFTARPVSAQFVPDCSNCSNAQWGAEWHPSLNTCVYSPSLGCGGSCNCAMGFRVGYGLSAKPDFFGGAFVRNVKGVVVGFRIDRPGPLELNRVKAGDVVTLINGHRPRRSDLGTQKRPIRSAEATWGSDGKLRLRFRY